MHKKPLYSIRDVKAETWTAPFAAESDLMARRALHRAANDPHSDICLFPEDFQLYCVGEFDTDSGGIQVLPQPQHIENATALKEKQNV